MRCALLIWLVGVLAACDVPRDPEGTLSDARGGTIRVGIVDQRPWATFDGHEAHGVEAELVRQLAAELGAQVEWVPGGESTLLEQLKRLELDLVIGGFVASSPWARHVGTTIPHATTYEHNTTRKHVFATPPGENGWTHRLDRFLYAHRGEGQQRRYAEEPR